jgi:pyridoxamine 5'-phosphate oxidase
MSRDPHHWAASLASIHAQVWNGLVRGVHDRRAPARHPALGTVTCDGLPSVRTVVLRSVDRPTACLDIHTDVHSAKMAELRARPYAALHVWDQSAHLQVRLDADVAILSGAEAAGTWARVPEASRTGYGSVPEPGQPIESALAYTKNSDPEAFAVLRLHVLTIDALHLGREHRRARFDRSNGWKGQWLAP